MSILTVCYEIAMNAENIRAYTVCTPFVLLHKTNLGKNSSGRNKWGSGGTHILAVGSCSQWQNVCGEETAKWTEGKRTPPAFVKMLPSTQHKPARWTLI